MNNYRTYGNHTTEFPPCNYKTASSTSSFIPLFGLSTIILISAVATCIFPSFCCYKWGFKRGQKSNQRNDQQEHPAQYQGQNTSNEISDEDHAYDEPRPLSNETSQNHHLELSAYEEVRENQVEGFIYQQIGEDVYLTPVFQQHPLSSVGAGN